MRFSWEKETEGVLRKADNLFAPPSLAWFEDLLPRLEATDPLTAMDHLLRGVLHQGHSSAFDQDTEAMPSESVPPPSYLRKENFTSTGSHRFTETHQVHARKKEYFHHESWEAYGRGSGFPTSQPGPTPEKMRTLSLVRNSPENRPDHPPMEATERTTPPEDPAGTTAQRTTRLLTGMPALRELFGAVTTQTRSGDLPDSGIFPPVTGNRRNEELSPPRSPAEVFIRETDGAEARRAVRPASGKNLPASGIVPPLSPLLSEEEKISAIQGTVERNMQPAEHRQTVYPDDTPPDRFVSTITAPFDNDVTNSTYSEPASTNATGFPQRNPRPDMNHPWQSMEGGATQTGMITPDLAWEEALFDRLLERWEERLRDQAIRHLGFTGGLI